MYVGNNFDAQQPTEDENFTFDYKLRLGTGEVIQSAVWTCEAEADPDAQLRVDGAPTIIGSKVVQRITRGLAGVNYLISCAANTNMRQNLVYFSYCQVVQPGS